MHTKRKGAALKTVERTRKYVEQQLNPLSATGALKSQTEIIH